MSIKFDMLKKIIKHAQEVMVDDDTAAAQKELANVPVLAAKLLLSLRQDTGALAAETTAPNVFTPASGNDTYLKVEDVKNLQSFLSWIVTNKITYNGAPFVWDANSFNFSSDQAKNQYIAANNGKISDWRLYDVKPNGANTVGTNTGDKYIHTNLDFFVLKDVFKEYIKSVHQQANGDPQLLPLITEIEMQANAADMRLGGDGINVTQALGLNDNQLLDAFNVIDDYTSIKDLIADKYDDAKVGNKYKYKVFGKDVKSYDTVKAWLSLNNLGDDANKTGSDPAYNPCWVIMKLYNRLKAILSLDLGDLKNIFVQYQSKLDALNDKCEISTGKQKQNQNQATTAPTQTQESSTSGQKTKFDSKFDSLLQLMSAVVTNSSNGYKIPLPDLSDLLQYLKTSNLFTSNVAGYIDTAYASLVSVGDVLSDTHHTKQALIDLVNPQRKYFAQLIAGKGGDPNTNFNVFYTKMTTMFSALDSVLNNLVSESNIDPAVKLTADTLKRYVGEWATGINTYFSPSSLASAYQSAMAGK